MQAKVTTYPKITQTSRPTSQGQKPKGRKNLNLEPRKSKHSKLKRERERERERERREILHKLMNNLETHKSKKKKKKNEEEIGKLPEKEFKIMIVKI